MTTLEERKAMIEEDKLLRFHERLKDFVSKHLNLFLNIVGILALIILLGFGYNFYTKKKEERSFAEFFKLLKEGGTEPALLAFAEKNSNTEAGKLALIQLWNTALERGDANATLKLADKIEKTLTSKGKVLVTYAKAKAYEEMGDIERALKIYKSVSKEDSPLRELVYLDLIRSIELKGDKNTALSFAKEFLKNFGNSTFSGYISAKFKGFSNF